MLLLLYLPTSKNSFTLCGSAYKCHLRSERNKVRMQRLKSKQYKPTSRTLLYRLSGHEDQAKYYREYNTAAACCRDTENWFSSSNDDVEGRKYYVRSSFDQTHNKANIYIYIYVYVYYCTASQMKQQWKKISNYDDGVTSQKYGSSLPSIYHTNSLSMYTKVYNI